MTIFSVKSGFWKRKPGKVPGLDAEVTRLKGELKEFRDKADAG